MFGIEIKWFILFAVIIVVGGGIERRVKQLNQLLSNEFIQLRNALDDLKSAIVEDRG